MGADASIPSVDVVMGTYNGARYLPEMLASLVAQQWPGLRLIACDDGSTDGTVELLESFTGLPIKLVRNAHNLGARDNFSQALRLAEAPYVALADQDDVWMPDKVRQMVARLQNLEAQQGGADRPALVYSDLRIVDGDLNLLSPSFFDGTFKSREARSLADFSISNHVPGCVIMANRALLQAALPVPPQAHMHDWWLCLTAAAMGRIDHVEAPLILFRRHGSNATDSGEQKTRGAWIGRALWRARRPLEYIRFRQEGTSYHATATNALLATVAERYGERMQPDARKALAALTSRHWWQRYGALRRAHSGDSPVNDLILSLQMGVTAHRGALTPDRGATTG